MLTCRWLRCDGEEASLEPCVGACGEQGALVVVWITFSGADALSRWSLQVRSGFLPHRVSGLH